MLSDKRLKCLKALGLRVPVVQGSATKQVVQGRTMRRHTEIPIAGNTESHKNYNDLLKEIARYKQLGVPIPVEFTADVARIAAELKNNNVVPRIGKEKYRMHGFESGATMPRIGKVKCHKHGLESGVKTGPDGSNQGMEQPLRKSYTENPKRAIPRTSRNKLAEPSAVFARKSHKDAQRKSHKDAQVKPVKSHKDAQSGLTNGARIEAWTGGELSDTVTRKTSGKTARIAAAELNSKITQ